MAADLHIIVVPEGIDLDELRHYSTWEFPGEDVPQDEFEALLDRVEAVSTALYTVEHPVDNVWVGACSPGKASMMENFRRYVPRAVETINNLYIKHGGVIRITPEIIPAITTAFNLPHDSFYESKFDNQGRLIPPSERWRGINKARSVKKFLWENIGKDTFCDLW